MRKTITTIFTIFGLAYAQVIIGGGAELGGGGGVAAYEASWGLCVGQNCALNDTVTVRRGISIAGTITACSVWADTAPTGTALIVDVLRNGVSIFSGAKLVLPIGEFYATTSTFGGTVALSVGNYLQVQLAQVGGTITGKDLFISCVY